MNTEESTHSAVRRQGKSFVEVPEQIASTSRSYQQTSTDKMHVTATGSEMITFVPILSALKGITLGNGTSQRTGSTIRISRFEVCINISADDSSDVFRWEPLEYQDAQRDVDWNSYAQRKLIDPRIRILAVTPRRKLTYIPEQTGYPFYAYGEGPGQIVPPLSAGNFNNYMVQQLDARAFDTHYDDVKNLMNRSSSTPQLTWYQDINVNSDFEYEDDVNALPRFGDNDLFNKVPFIWLYQPKQAYAGNTAALRINISVRVLYDCL